LAAIARPVANLERAATKRIFVSADFGTTSSGYRYAFDSNSDVLEVTNYKDMPYSYPKTKTALLYKKPPPTAAANGAAGFDFEFDEVDQLAADAGQLRVSDTAAGAGAAPVEWGWTADKVYQAMSDEERVQHVYLDNIKLALDRRSGGQYQLPAGFQVCATCSCPAAISRCGCVVCLHGAAVATAAAAAAGVVCGASCPCCC
jgi:hypothetical protein